MALSLLIVNAYRRLGHGAKILSSYTARLFHVSAVIYVDDTDLLHWPSDGGTDPDELVLHVQEATRDYGLLVQASGGILKEKKCSMYFLDYKVVRGRFWLKSLRDLPEPQIYLLKRRGDATLHTFGSHSQTARTLSLRPTTSQLLRKCLVFTSPQLVRQPLMSTAW
jgi:hypothetical protein